MLEITRREELPLDAPLPEGGELILLARPEGDVLASTAGPELLLRYWRLLFHERARQAIWQALGREASPQRGVQERIERLGRSAYHEARFVLQRERYLANSADDLEAYAEFGAQYLEFTYFAPAALAWFFPGVTDAAAALALLSRDVDGDALLKGTRPTGAADPGLGGSAAGGEDVPEPVKGKRRVRRDGAHRERLLSQADKADSVGNDVRAAIFRMRVYRASFLPGSSRDNLSSVYADALKDLDQLAARLKAALGLDDSTARQWRAWLVALLENAAGGWWNAEGRLLYDLQKICVYHEREIYSVNVMDWLIDRCKRPLRRPQPGQRLVLTIKALRSAQNRTARARLSPHGRAELQRLFGAAIHDAEQRLRNSLRTPIGAALAEGGLHPANATETVALEKLTEELLDEMVNDGYLTFPAVRDAVSRNQMKLDDLGSAAAKPGDQLLRVDRKLEDNLDFVYHRAEIYLRGFHRLSSIFFATEAGRWITRWVILPFGGAFLLLEALDHSLGLLIHKLLSNRRLVAAAAESASHAFAPTSTGAPHASESHALFNQWWLLLLLGLFLLGVINVPRFRAAVSKGFKHVFHWMGALFIDFPKWVVTRPAVVAFLRSRFALMLGRYVLKPLLMAGLVSLFVPETATPTAHALTLAWAFLGINIILNSRAGRALEQAVLHALRTTFARLGWEILVALIRGIAQIFQSILEGVDRLLYAVDELLRFRAGQKQSTVVIKAVLGIFWFFIAYATRFIINLLIEPQINPIKHFPVVTVSHKLLFPTIPYLAGILQTFRMDRATALADAAAIVWCIPGIFGFLAWEFKENWKLYKANRSRVLKPIRAGSHGETLATFLRPGFHSGTIPKIFHRLRKAQLQSAAQLPANNKHRQAAHHVQEALVAYFEREFVAQLNHHPLFRDCPIRVGHVSLGTTLIRAEFHRIPQEAAPLVLVFEQRSLWILAGIEQPGWALELSTEQTRQFSAGLMGLYKLSGVELVVEHLKELFGPAAHFDLRRNDLIVWRDDTFSDQAVYDLSADGPIAPRGNAEEFPTLTQDQILFSRLAIKREDWIGLWETQAVRGAFPVVQVMPASNDNEPDHVRDLASTLARVHS